MNKKPIKLFSIVLIFLIAIYVGSYFFRTRIDADDSSLYAGNDNVVWVFGTLRQQMEVYLDPESDAHKREQSLRKFYWPLIKIDRYIFSRYHFFEPNRPKTLGG